MTSLFRDLELERFISLIYANPDLVHELNDQGETPLFVQTSLPYIRVLIRAGANPLHQNIHGDTVLHQSGNSPECIRYLASQAHFFGIPNNNGDCVEDFVEIQDALNIVWENSAEGTTENSSEETAEETTEETVEETAEETAEETTEETAEETSSEETAEKTSSEPEPVQRTFAMPINGFHHKNFTP